MSRVIHIKDVRKAGIALLFLFFAHTLRADHFMGGSITFAMTSKTTLAGSPVVNTRTFKITLKFYRNCSGYMPDDIAKVYFSPSVNGQTTSLDLTRVSFSDITPTCPGTSSTCQASPTLPYGVQEHVYEGYITFNVAAPHPPVTIQYSSCCRNYAITNVSAPGEWYISSDLNPNFDDSSPSFTSIPVFFISKCEPFNFNPSAVDAEGDSLAFQMTNCLMPLTYQPNTNNEIVLTTQSVAYIPPFSGKYPVTSSCPPIFDSITGIFSFLPVNYEISIFNYRISEFRKGIKIGEVNRDIQVQIVANANNSPGFIKPVCSHYIYSCNGVVPISCDTVICANSALSFLTEASDVDSNSVTVSASGLPAGATFKPVSTGHNYDVKNTLNWVPSTSDTGKTFKISLKATDDGCGLSGISSFSYKIKVKACGAAVAIELLDFSGKHFQDRNIITWRFATEENILHYELERSSDGIHFMSIYKASPVARLLTPTYDFSDRNIYVGTGLYYRLKIKSGAEYEYYSAIIFINPAETDKRFHVKSLYPNPSDGNFKLNIQSEKEEIISFEIVNIFGQKVTENTLHTLIGDNVIPLKISPSDGIYFLNVRDENGSMEALKLLKKEN